MPSRFSFSCGKKKINIWETSTPGVSLSSTEHAWTTLLFTSSDDFSVSIPCSPNPTWLTAQSVTADCRPSLGSLQVISVRSCITLDAVAAIFQAETQTNSGSLSFTFKPSIWRRKISEVNNTEGVLPLIKQHNRLKHFSCKKKRKILKTTSTFYTGSVVFSKCTTEKCRFNFNANKIFSFFFLYQWASTRLHCYAGTFPQAAPSRTPQGKASFLA